MRKIWALDGNFPIDAAKFQPNTSSNQTTAAPNMLTNSQLAVSSVPDGADIEVDDNFVGNTPSVVELVYVVRFPISSEWGIRRTMLELLTALVVLGVLLPIPHLRVA